MASAGPQSIQAQILPNGHVQFVAGGPEFSNRQLKRQLLKIKLETAVRAVHLYSRSEASFSHIGEVVSCFKSLGFDVIAVD